jgi:hypothetical protein
MAPMRAPRSIVAVAVIAASVAAGCSSEKTPPASKAFCNAANRYNNEIVREQKKGKIDTQRQIAIVEDLAANAPRAIRSDTQTFLDALRRVDSDPSLKSDPKIKDAVDSVNRYANKACGVYSRDSGV